jgi:chromosome partitioning protein
MKVITVCSFKGGTAKTSTMLHIAAGLALFHHKKVLAIDFDAQANLTSGLGFDADSLDSMASVLQGEKKLDEVIQKTFIPGLDLVPADIWLERVEVTGALASDRYSHERLRDILKQFEGRYDYVWIDTPPSLCWLTESALIASNLALVCATPEFYSVKGLQRLAEFIQGMSERHGLHVLGVCLSFWNSRGKNNRSFLDLIEANFPGKCLKQKIRRDVAVCEAAIYGKPVYESHPQSRAAEDFKALTQEIFSLLRSKTKG